MGAMVLNRLVVVGGLLLVGAAAIAGRADAGDAAVVAPAKAPAVPVTGRAGCHGAGDVCFIAIGDQGTGLDKKQPGLTPPENQYRVGAAMTEWQKRNTTQFVIGLGDNFYVCPVSPLPACGLTDVRKAENIRSRFEDPYRGMPQKFYMSVGNHDYLGTTPDPILAYAKTSTKWHMPATCYTFRQGDAEFFVIDTELILKNFGMLSPLYFTGTRPLRWLEHVLSKSKARWKIVYGHHPPFSNGNHADNQEMIDKVLPLLVKYRVDAYIAGHEHNQQHLVPKHPGIPDLSNIDFVVSGAAGDAGANPVGDNGLKRDVKRDAFFCPPGAASPCPDVNARHRQLSRQNGFAYFKLEKDNISIRFVSADEREAGLPYKEFYSEYVRRKSPRWTYTGPVAPEPTPCGPGAEEQAGLCYPKCRAEYHGVGPVCWQRCPARYSDDGATCRRDAHIIGSDNSKCPWHDKCGLVTEKGCSKCPAGYHNDGCTCRKDVHIFGKKSYGRGVGKVPWTW
jgi:calcineurin-like phosphoesterase family protein